VRGARRQQVLGAVVDVARDPRWGRFEETFGEDPYCFRAWAWRRFAASRGEARRPRRPCIATLKHMTGHGQPESGTNVGPASFGERTLREFFFPPFETAIKLGHAAA